MRRTRYGCEIEQKQANFKIVTSSESEIQLRGQLNFLRLQNLQQVCNILHFKCPHFLSNMNSKFSSGHHYKQCFDWLQKYSPRNWLTQG